MRLALVIANPIAANRKPKPIALLLPSATVGRPFRAGVSRHKFRLFNDVRLLRATKRTRICVVSAAWLTRDGQEVEYQQRDPDIDGRVGDIKDEKVTAKGMQIEIVNDRSMRKAINGVA